LLALDGLFSFYTGSKAGCNTSETDTCPILCGTMLTACQVKKESE
jgi:hypothetical protein